MAVRLLLEAVSQSPVYATDQLRDLIFFKATLPWQRQVVPHFSSLSLQ
jgi:hypothetical protein